MEEMKLCVRIALLLFVSWLFPKFITFIHLSLDVAWSVGACHIVYDIRKYTCSECSLLLSSVSQGWNSGLVPQAFVCWDISYSQAWTFATQKPITSSIHNIIRTLHRKIRKFQKNQLKLCTHTFYWKDNLIRLKNSKIIITSLIRKLIVKED